MALSNWDTAGKEEGSLYVVLFISRNKDNKNIENFTERRQSFVCHSVNPMTDERLKEKFKDFLSGGVPGETCRLYVSVNKRDEEKAKKALMVELITKDDVKLSRIAAIAASLCAKKENAAENKWMFDFDINDESKLKEFVRDIKDLNVVSHITSFAVTLQRRCSSTAKQLQWHCIYVAAALQKRCTGFAVSIWYL